MNNNEQKNLDEKTYSENYETKLKISLEEEKKSINGFFIRKFRFTYLIIAAIVIGGVYSLFTLPKEAEPEVKVPFAIVTTVYPGATPNDIEDLVTNKIEDKIKNLENLNTFNSSSNNGFSSIFVEYEADADLKESFRKLREAVDEVKTEIPDEAELPVVTEINFNDIPIVTYSLIGDYDKVELKKFADTVQVEFEDIKDVSKAPIIGGLEQEYQVIVNQSKMTQYNLSLGQIVNSIQLSNFSLPAGNIEVDGFKYNVRVKGKFTDVKDLENVVIATYNESPVFLNDVALIKDGFKDVSTESFIGLKGDEESTQTISLQIFKKSGGNILNIVNESQQAINDLLENDKLPKDLKVKITNDNSVFIKKDIKTLGTSAIQTFILITVILMLILSFRGAIITALAVPIAFLMSFIFLKIQGMTLNSMVLFSLVLSLGLMVDNAIIVIEGVNEYIEEYKKNVFEAAILSVWNFKWAITSGTMTTVAAFLPMLLVSGIMGEYMGILPKTITVTLLSSLFVALVVIPTLITRFLKVSSNGNNKSRNKKRHIYIENLFNKLKDKYTTFMESTIHSKAKRWKYIGLSIILFIIAALTPIVGIMKIQMFPKIDIEYFVVNIELPVGSTLNKTRKVSKEVEKIISTIPELDNYVTNVGSSASLGHGESGSSAEHLSSITVNLVDQKERKRKSYEIADSVRPELEKIQNAKIRIEELSAGPPSGAPIEVRVYGADYKELTKLVTRIEDYFDTVDGAINIKDNLESSTGDFVFTIDKQKANYYGLNIVNIASTLRNAIYGTKASVVNINGDDVDITVKYSSNKFKSTSDLEEILLTTPTGKNISLKEVAEINIEPSLTSINHREGDRMVAVTADLKKGANLQTINNDFNEFQKTLNLKEGYTIKVGGETEDIQKSFREIFLSMIVALILIAMILTLQFNSFKQPFIIIFSLPLALIGVFIGLNITRQAFSLPAFIGIVSLSGIVVNDAIVLIDRINKNIANGMEFYRAIIEAGLARMQPIFLTSITTIAGIFPLIFADELWMGLSITVISGLIFSTFLTLVIIPFIYAGMCKEEKCGKI